MPFLGLVQIPSRVTLPQRRILLALYLGFAVVVRSPDAWRPIDGSTWELWREADVGAIARSFYREDMNILRPRIDWRGDGPGLVESEFPLYPWSVAALYRVFGYHEALARVVSLVVSVLACWVFFLLAERLLPPLGWLAAIAVFAVNPLAVRLSTAVQPEPLMFLFYLAAARWFLRWIDAGRRTDYALAATFTALAILSKLPAANLGLFFAALSLQRFGWRGIARWDLWLFAILALGPAAAWYSFAYGYWTTYGNSLGMSNEAYAPIASFGFMEALPRQIVNCARIEIRAVWTLPGALLALAGIPSLRSWEGRVVLYWLLTLAVFYVVTIGTTGEDWASYYHIVSLPAACLAIGFGVVHLLSRVSRGRVGVAMAFAGVVLLSGVGLLEMRKTLAQIHPSYAKPIYECARRFAPLVPEGAVIVASGGEDIDQWGIRNAANAPYFFFWLDRKGFSLPDSQQHLEALEELRGRGARYFVAEPSRLTRAAGFETELRRTYRVAAECDKAILFDLGAAP
jgi:hypothetical protein